MSKEVKDAKGSFERQSRTTAMELGTVKAETDRRDQHAAEQVARDGQIAKCHEIIGRIQAVKMMSDFANVGGLLWVRQVRETKIYKDLPDIGTWEKFCKYIGSSRQKIEEDLENLAVFGEAFTTTLGAFGVGYHDLRKLRQLTHDGAVTIDVESVKIGDETISFSKDRAEDLQAAIEHILEKNTKLTTRVKKLEKDKDDIVREETKSLFLEKELAVKELKRLKAFDPETKDRSWSVEQLASLNKDGNSYCNAISKFILDPRMKDDWSLVTQIHALICEAELTLRDLRNRFDAEHDTNVERIVYGE